MSAFHKFMGTVSILLAATLAGCGGGSGGGTTTAGIGGTGQIASGTVTAFGSIFVNGIEFFDVDTATCIIDGNDSSGACQGNLELGMVVKVTGSVNGATGNATQIVYDDDVDGPISGITPSTANLGPADVTRSFTIFNIPVLIDSAATTFSGARDFSTLTDNDVVEVSGFFDNNGVLHATYLRYKGGLVLGATSVELHGTVTATTPAAGASAAGDTVTVNGITATLAAGVDLSDVPGGTVRSGDLVEIRGTLTGASAIDADRIEQEDARIGGDGDEVSIEGLITHFVDAGNFRVDGQAVDAGSAVLEPLNLQLANGVKVEVEGTISGSTLVATKVEARGNDIKLEAEVASRDTVANTVTLQFANGTVTVQLNNQTQMEDTMAGGMITLGAVQAGDFLEVRGFLGDNPAAPVVASEVRRSALDDAIIEAPVDSFVSNAGVTLLGVPFDTVNGTTVFLDETGGSELVISEAQFYAGLQAGCIVKIQDSNTPLATADGIADEAELESCP